jgi:hypothetical protein
MNEFGYLADLDRAENLDLMRLSMRPATTSAGTRGCHRRTSRDWTNLARGLTRAEV